MSTSTTLPKELQSAGLSISDKEAVPETIQSEVSTNGLEAVVTGVMARHNPVESELLALKYSIFKNGPSGYTPQGIKTIHRWMGWIVLFPAIIVALVTWLYRFYKLPSILLRKDWDNKKKITHFLTTAPERVFPLFDGHPLGRRVRQGVTTFRALEPIYASPAMPWGDSWRDRAAKFFFEQPDSQGVINRAYFVYSYVIEELTRLSKLYPTIKWLGLASGSAWPVLEGVAYFRHHINSDIPIELTLVDMDDDALEMAKKIAAHLGIADVITCVKRKIDDFLNESTEEYHGIEIFGFFDYKPGAKISAYCRKIRKRLKENGVMLAALICPSPMPWAFNVEYIVGWPLLRRRKLSVVKKIILDGGSREDEMLLEVEPCRVHALVRCYKRSSHQERLCP